MRAIVTDAWATPPKELERSPRGPRILRDALLLVGALALTGVVAVFTMHLLRGQAAPAMATQPPPIPPAMNERSARPSPPERFVAGGELRGPPGPLQAPARSPELGATTRRDGAERAHGAHHVAQGSLRVAAHPWAQVSIDGRAVGTTPLSSMTITEGKHSIVFTNSELGISAQRRVIVRAGQESVLVVDLFAEKSKRR